MPSSSSVKVKLDPQMKANLTLSVEWVGGWVVGWVCGWRLRLISTQVVVEVEV